MEPSLLEEAKAMLSKKTCSTFTINIQSGGSYGYAVS